jgi:hypothetical protein
MQCQKNFETQKKGNSLIIFKEVNANNVNNDNSNSKTVKSALCSNTTVWMGIRKQKQNVSLKVCNVCHDIDELSNKKVMVVSKECNPIRHGTCGIKNPLFSQNETHKYINFVMH